MSHFSKTQLEAINRAEHANDGDAVIDPLETTKYAHLGADVYYRRGELYSLNPLISEYDAIL